MSAVALPLASTSSALAAPTRTLSATLRILFTEMRYEVVRALRTRAYSLAAIGFPVMFYALFGLLLNRGESTGGVLVSKYLLGGYSVFGALGAAVFGFGVGVALDINAGWLELKRASPMPPLAYLLSKVAMAGAFSVLIVCLLTVLGVAVGHVHITLLEFAKIVGIAAFGAIPFSCLGMAMAFLVPPTSAAGIANLIYLPMSFLSGLWVPLGALPHVVQQIAHFLPSYHLAQMMYSALGASNKGTLLTHLGAIAAFTVAMLALTLVGYRRKEQNA